MATNPTPLLSIVTITYNNLEGLQKTAQSITTQTCNHYEWIVIDGNSDDGIKGLPKPMGNIRCS